MGYYCMARTIDEAVTLLKGSESRIIAGGTDLILDLRNGKKICRSVVDISEISECRQISYENGALKIGACCTFAQMESNPLVLRYATALAQAAAQVGSPQIRNIATVGGNVVNAMPAADAAVALAGLDARVEIIGRQGKRFCNIAECYCGIGKSAVDASSELISAFYLPVKEDGSIKSVYKRFALRTSLALPVVAVSASVEMEALRIKSCHIVVAPAGNAPWQAEEAMAHLSGKMASELVIRQAAGIAAKDAPFRDSPVRCSATYKHELARVLVTDALQEILPVRTNRE